MSAGAGAVARKDSVSFAITNWFEDHSKEHSRKINMVVALIFLAISVTALAYLPLGSRPFIAISSFGVGSFVTLLALYRMRFFPRFSMDFTFSQNRANYYYRQDFSKQFDRDFPCGYYAFKDQKAFLDECETQFRSVVSGNELIWVLSHLRSSGSDQISFERSINNDTRVTKKVEVKEIYQTKRRKAFDRYLATLIPQASLYPYLTQGVIADFLSIPLFAHVLKNNEEAHYTQMKPDKAASCNSGFRIYTNLAGHLCVEIVQKIEKVKLEDRSVLHYCIAKANINFKTRKVCLDGEELMRPPQHVSHYFSA